MGMRRYLYRLIRNIVNSLGKALDKIVKPGHSGESSMALRLLCIAYLLEPRRWKVFQKISSHPWRTLIHILWRKDRHVLRLPDPVELHILPSNLVALTSLWGKLPLAKVEAHRNMLVWQVSPSAQIFTETHRSIDLMVLNEVFVNKDYGEAYKGLRVLDIGGYRGETSLYFLLRGAKEVICIEPNPELVDKIKVHIEKAGLVDRFRLYPVAIGAADGESFLYITPEEINSALEDLVVGGIVTDSAHGYGQITKIQVPVWSLSRLLQETGWEEIDVVKLDCEGCEFHIFEATSEADLRRVKVWIMEVHGDGRKIAERLRSIGYEVFYDAGYGVGTQHLKAFLPGAKVPW